MSDACQVILLAGATEWQRLLDVPGIGRFVAALSRVVEDVAEDRGVMVLFSHAIKLLGATVGQP